MNILVTGAAGFIGFHVCKKLIDNGHNVMGLDNINSYYSEQLKIDRLHELGIYGDIKEGVEMQSMSCSNFTFIKLDISNYDLLYPVFKAKQFEKICHLAAQAGVRYSIENPWAYINSNVTGFLNVMQSAVNSNCSHVIYASSSSVYGNAAQFPFAENFSTDQPESIYAVTKKTNEMMAFTYRQLYKLNTTGLRFFTVYGPWGRPDMAPMLFADAIYNGTPIKVYNNGDLLRDFTYVDDITEGIVRVINSPAATLSPVYNIGHGAPVKLLNFIDILEKEIGTKSRRIYEKMQLGDVYATYADTASLKTAVNYQPETSLEKGIKEFIIWYKKYFHK